MIIKYDIDGRIIWQTNPKSINSHKISYFDNDIIMIENSYYHLSKINNKTGEIIVTYDFIGTNKSNTNNIQNGNNITIYIPNARKFPMKISNLVHFFTLNKNKIIIGLDHDVYFFNMKNLRLRFICQYKYEIYFNSKTKELFVIFNNHIEKWHIKYGFLQKIKCEYKKIQFMDNYHD